MPIVEAHILEGYADVEKNRLTSALTDAIRFVVPAPDEAITVLIKEYPTASYARGGVARQPAAALPDPKQIVLDYLAAMEKRDLRKAQSMLDDAFQMIFPGTHAMTSLVELVDWAKSRYLFVTKSYDAVEAFHSDGVAVVYARGTLAGEWLSGAPFAGIRFIDRFEIRDGRIIRQDVWNDLAEVRAQ